MSLEQQTDWLYDPYGERYPVLSLRIEGVHDVGRIIATLARGNVEHAGLAYEVGRELNRTAGGRTVLAYLEGHGGPKLAPAPCDECAEGQHADCHQLNEHDPAAGVVCGCYEAGEGPHARRRRPA